LTIALGFDSDQDWSTAVSRKRRRAKKDDDDEDDDYVVAAQPKPVSEDGVAKIMSTLLQAREAWVIIKLLSRLEVVLLEAILMLDER
jgi:histone-lysine N-methyltransferase SETD2